MTEVCVYVLQEHKQDAEDLIKVHTLRHVDSHSALEMFPILQTHTLQLSCCILMASRKSWTVRTVQAAVQYLYI